MPVYRAICILMSFLRIDKIVTTSECMWQKTYLGQGNCFLSRKQLFDEGEFFRKIEFLEGIESALTQRHALVFRVFACSVNVQPAS